jgi:hypothetical protein
MGLCFFGTRLADAVYLSRDRLSEIKEKRSDNYAQTACGWESANNLSN